MDHIGSLYWLDKNKEKALNINSRYLNIIKNKK